MLTHRFIALFIVVIIFGSFHNNIQAQNNYHSKLTLQLDSQHQFSHAGFYVALEQGFYTKKGLTVTVKATTEESPSPISLLTNNEVEYIISGSNIIYDLNLHYDLRLLTTIEQLSPWVLLTHPKRTIDSLKGSLIAIDKQAIEIESMFQKAGLNKSDYRIKSSNDIDLFTQGYVDAIAVKITDLPHIPSLLNISYELINPRAFELNFYGASIITTKEHLENNATQAEHFKQATIEGWQYALEHPEYSAKLIKSKYNPLLSYDSLLLEAKQIKYLMQPQLIDIGNSTTLQWQNIAQQLNITNLHTNINDFVFHGDSTHITLSHPLIFLFSLILTVLILIPVSILWRSKHVAIKKIRLMNSILKTQQQASIDGILTFNAEGKLVSVNKQLIQLWKLTDNKFKKMDSWRVIYSMVKKVSDSKEFIASVRMHNADNKMQSFAEILLKDGRTFERFSAPLFDDHKVFLGRFWSFRDITQRKLAEDKIWLQANFDSLTDLPNRLMFKERLIFEIKKISRTDKQIALLFLDVDHFKEINDSMGHDVGDLLLIEVAARLKKCVRDIDMVARLGGDEFTIILSDLENLSAIERIANNILTTLAMPFQLNEKPHYITTSIGITFSPSDSVDDVQLLKYADQAMYLAKNSGRNNFQYFTQELQIQANKRVSLSNDLRNAIDKNQLFLEYQPIVCLKTNSIIKAEALLRWQHPELGLISPDDFIELAEETGLINSIGEWVFDQALKQIKILQLEVPDFTISVNTSPVQYHSESINPQKWNDKLIQQGIKEKSIIVELTETLLISSNDNSSDILKQFKDYNIPIALDDFGTGYSSMSYLNKFDIDFLKIDRSFVSNLTPNSKDLALCQAIITMAKSLGMQVIAEGIETKKQQKLLADMGCDCGQGYLFSKPLSSSAIKNIISK